MNRKLVSGVLGGIAAIVLAAGGSTTAAFDDAADIPQSSAGAGVLRLDLTGSGQASARVGVTDLLPGGEYRQALWVSDDASSAAAGTLAVAVDHLVDTAAPCATSRGKAEGELASGIAGCVIDAASVSGTPVVGTASRVIAATIAYGGSGDAESCATAGTVRSLTGPARPGNLRLLAARGGTPIAVVGADSAPVRLAAGQGACLVVDLAFPPDTTPTADASPDHPVDDAAQGDSLHVTLDVALTQVAP